MCAQWFLRVYACDSVVFVCVCKIAVFREFSVSGKVGGCTAAMV